MPERAEPAASDEPEPSPPRAPSPIVGLEAIAAGVHHACALDHGRVLCWGLDRRGMLGVGEHGLGEFVTTPMPVLGLADAGPIVQLDADYDFTCALGQDGGVWCWGVNDEGQLGVGDLDLRARPTRLPDTRARSIALGHARACMFELESDEGQRVWCWGRGEFGDGVQRVRELRPVEIGALAGFERLATPEPRCGLTAAGGVLCWGYNGSGQVGNGEGGCEYDEPLCADCKRLPEETCKRVDHPVAPLELPVIVDLATSTHISYALDREGGVWQWGQTGHIMSFNPQPHYRPRRIAELAPMVELDAGASHACTRSETGELWCWGNDSFGQLGFENLDLRTSEFAQPRRVEGLPPVRAIAAGFYFTCALTGEGAATQAWCWGDNGSGQLGDGTTERRHAPVLVRTLGE